MRAAAKKNNRLARKFFKKYFKNISKSVDFLKEICYTIRVERLREKTQSHSDLLIEERDESIHTFITILLNFASIKFDFSLS